MKKTLLIIPDYSKNTLADIGSHFYDLEIVKTITYKEFIELIAKSNDKDYEAVIIDNGRDVNKNALNIIIDYFSRLNIVIYLYKRLCYDVDGGDRINYLCCAETDEKSLNSVEVPIIYIAGNGTMGEIINCHIQLSQALSRKSLTPLNISNHPLSESIGYLNIESYLRESDIMLKRIKEEINTYISRSINDTDLIIISNMDDCIDKRACFQNININDLIKNLIPYDYVIYLVSMDNYNMEVIGNLYEKIRLITNSSFVNLFLSHYFSDCIKKNNFNNYLFANSLDYQKVLTKLNSENNLRIFDPLSVDDINRYCEIICANYC